MNPDPTQPNSTQPPTGRNHLPVPPHNSGFPLPPRKSPSDWQEIPCDHDYDEDERERELLHEDLASDSEDFARSGEDGWYYSDED